MTPEGAQGRFASTRKSKSCWISPIISKFMKLFIILYYFVIVSAEKGYDDGFCDSACGLVALVPARGGSKGIPLKNLAQLDGQSLLCRILTIIKKSKTFEGIWVSTDVESIATEAVRCGAMVHWRSAESATDSATTLSVVQDFLKIHQGIQTIAVVQCTSPFLCPEYLTKASEMLKNPKTDCVFSVTRNFKLRWKINSSGFAEAENFDPKNRPRRQDWSGELYETGMFYFFKRHLIQDGVLQNKKCQILQVPLNRSLEIDTVMDLEMAKMLYPTLNKC